MQLVNHFIWKVMAFKMARCVATVTHGFNALYQPVVEFSGHEMNIMIRVCMVFLFVDFGKQFTANRHHTCHIPLLHATTSLMYTYG